MNAAAYAALRQARTVNYVGPLNPPGSRWQRAVSKIARATSCRGNFSWFSEQRLAYIAEQVNERCDPAATADFFHGFTPWIRTAPTRPYVAWSDCTFKDYVDIFHDRRKFRQIDLERIQEAEAHWLKQAQRVLFTSEWAAQRAVQHYALDDKLVGSVGIFGEVEPPMCDVYNGSEEFVFVSTNFKTKGGPTVVAAFQTVKRRHPRATLKVIGDRPTRPSAQPGVSYLGFLRKESPAEYEQFERILSGARALVNATKSDTAPVLLIEAGYFGCPVISTRRFAIPEIVAEGHSGLLVDRPDDPGCVAEAMCWMLEHEERYLGMRSAAWTRTRDLYSRARFGHRLRNAFIESVHEQA